MTSSLTFRGAPVSSSPAHQGTYDVFLSCRGEDTRRDFTSHLYDALDRRGINTYIDDEDLIREESISSGLPKAIEESRTSVVVLSENYAASSRCLNVLQKILECKKTKGQIVIPVFYHVEATVVRHQIKSFGEALFTHEKRFKDDLRKVEKWRTALTQIANLNGLHLIDNRDEAKCIGEIVQTIANHIKAAKHVAKHPIAIKSPLHVPDSPSSPAQVLDSSSSPGPVGIESPAQVPDSSSSPSPVGIESPAQVPDSSSSPSPVGIQAPVQAPNWSSSLSGNGEQGSNPSISSEQGSNQGSNPSISSEQGSNPSISSEQGSNPSISSEGVILFLIASVIGLLQLNDLFKTYPANMWIAEAALVMFCLSYATMTKIDGTHWARWSRTINGFRVLSGTLVLASLSSIQLPHRIWWLFFAVWALLGFIFVAYTWMSHSRVDGRDDVEMGQMIPLIRPTTCLTPVENSSDAAHS